MTEKRSEWQTEELAKTYLEGVRGAIPGAEMQLAVIGKIARRWCADPVRILDLGCGNGILGRFLLNLFPQARGTFIDFSEAMLEAARKNVGTLPGAIMAKADFSAPAWIQVVKPYGPFDIAVSGFAIHHQSNQRKRRLYSEIYELLSPGGVFLNLEHVASATPAGERLFEDFFIDNLHAFHLKSDPGSDREKVAAAFYHRPDKEENVLAPVADQCQWLREIGFSEVDCFFKVFELALFGGRKPVS